MTTDLNTREEANNEPEAVAEDSITAGQLLHDARVARGLSLKDVSDNINLKLSVIGNIEQDIDDADISSIFMRGYIRCYARYLKLSEAEVLAIYDCQQTDCSQQEAELQSFSRRTKQEAHDNRLMLASYGILGFMLVIFLIWGFQRSDVSVVVPEQNIEASTAVETPAELVKASDSDIKPRVMPKVTLEQVEQMVESFQPTTTDEPAPISVTPVATLAPTLDLPIEPISQPTSTPVVITTPTTSAEVIEIEDDIMTSDDLAESEAEDVIQGLVELTFVGDCWVEIKNSQGKVLITGVKQAGQTLQLQGEIPLNVKLGAPEQVQMRFAGADIDLSKFRKGRLAKFELPM